MRKTPSYVVVGAVLAITGYCQGTLARIPVTGTAGLAGCAPNYPSQPVKINYDNNESYVVFIPVKDDTSLPNNFGSPALTPSPDGQLRCTYLDSGDCLSEDCKPNPQSVKVLGPASDTNFCSIVWLPNNGSLKITNLTAIDPPLELPGHPFDITCHSNKPRSPLPYTYNRNLEARSDSTVLNTTAAQDLSGCIPGDGVTHVKWTTIDGYDYNCWTKADGLRNYLGPYFGEQLTIVNTRCSVYRGGQYECGFCDIQYDKFEIMSKNVHCLIQFWNDELLKKEEWLFSSGYWYVRARSAPKRMICFSDFPSKEALAAASEDPEQIKYGIRDTAAAEIVDLSTVRHEVEARTNSSVLSNTSAQDLSGCIGGLNLIKIVWRTAGNVDYNLFTPPDGLRKTLDNANNPTAIDLRCSWAQAGKYTCGFCGVAYKTFDIDQSWAWCLVTFEEGQGSAKFRQFLFHWGLWTVEGGIHPEWLICWDHEPGPNKRAAVGVIGEVISFAGAVAGDEVYPGIRYLGPSRNTSDAMDTLVAEDFSTVDGFKT